MYHRITTVVHQSPSRLDFFSPSTQSLVFVSPFSSRVLQLLLLFYFCSGVCVVVGGGGVPLVHFILCHFLTCFTSLKFNHISCRWDLILSELHPGQTSHSAFFILAFFLSFVFFCSCFFFYFSSSPLHVAAQRHTVFTLNKTYVASLLLLSLLN